MKQSHYAELQAIKKAVREYCLGCMLEQKKDCGITDCELYKFNAFRKKK